ncbi:protein of unknown function DUF214 [Actinobacteria bacterium OK074]|nr:protein of unknown function DUF214 [Actinobacteria bacterium OK074]
MSAPRGIRQWFRDLGMGARFAFTGGREGWTRLLLTGVGVGLGVALLLVTAALPSVLNARDAREAARDDMSWGVAAAKRSDHSVVVANVDADFRDQTVRGRELEPEGPNSPLPPGLGAFPKTGEMVVSPALKTLLSAGSGKLLRERLPDRIVGTIGEQGLVGPSELAYYAGGKDLLAKGEGMGQVARIDRFGSSSNSGSEPLDPVLLLLVVVVFVVLLMPVAVFIAAAVRFGGERRDRRLAALRLVGSDAGMTRRIAAGEALAGAALGLLFGTVFFLILRQLAAQVTLFEVSVFPSYLDPSPALALLVALAVPAAAVLVTLLALRGVVIEPLGVVRTARPARRRLWWRLLLPLAGLALLAPMIGKGSGSGNFNEYQVTGGVLLLLVGVTALLPWFVETVVARLGNGPVAWQLAVRRLQLSSGTAARLVNGIAVAVAGAIALQMVFTGVQGDYTPSAEDLGDVPSQMQIYLPTNVQPATAQQQFLATKGVRQAVGLSEGSFSTKRTDPDNTAPLNVAGCATLEMLAKLSSCRDGDVFVVRSPDDDSATKKLMRPGTHVYVNPSYSDSEPGTETAWTVPSKMVEVRLRADSPERLLSGLLVTPGALPAQAQQGLSGYAYVNMDLDVPDVRDLVRNTAARLDPLTNAVDWTPSDRSQQYQAIETGLFVGATCVLALIGASLLISQLEQLRERRRLLSALVAFGTRRRTLSLSVLWQTTVPIALGLLLAALVGVTLGAVLMRMTDVPVAVDWSSVLSMTGVGAAVVLVVTLLSLPPLWRLMRPEGLRTE